MGIKTKLIVGFVLLEITDFLPLPTTTMVAVYIVLKKPLWFKNMIMELYREEDRPDKPD
ncbi:hypothetical protein [Methylobacter luteus]|uniref:hypothetical protein n=1 Tax=Methylobacter luteus TaxID=415 RepID=UPI00041E7A9D|nr:hypothetical protein [Methylobacter luteus]